MATSNRRSSGSRQPQSTQASTPPTLKYTKVPLPAAVNLNRLWHKGLMINDTDDGISAEKALESIGYFRLLIYMRKYQSTNGQFFPKTRFSDLVRLYDFDRELKSITTDAVERLEVKLRAALSNPLSITHGAHWHLDASHFADVIKHHQVMSKIIGAVDHKKKIALNHYYAKYSEPRLPPVWLTCEKLSFGALSWMFSDLNTAPRKVVAKYWNIPEPLLVSWFRTLTDLRNECAHHGRLWRGQFTANSPERHTSFAADFRNINTFYTRACVVAILLGTMEKKKWWRESLQAIFAKYPAVSPLQDLGFPLGWEARPLWT